MEPNFQRTDWIRRNTWTESTSSPGQASIEKVGVPSFLATTPASPFIAIHEEFAYPTLHSVADAKGLLPTTAPIFAKIGTADFEHVLLACWYAEHVNMALGTPSADISAANSEVRTALIEAVHSVHPVHADVTSDLQRVGAFASSFLTVVSLNYDLTLYWAMLLFNSAHGSWFKDAFNHVEFQTDWGYLRRPLPPTGGATLVFYPHGSLAVARDYIGDETKISVGAGAAGDLLDTITRNIPRQLSGGLHAKGSSHQRFYRRPINGRNNLCRSV